MSEEAEGGGIFLSYRRQESKHFAGRLYDRLADQFGKGQVFMDVDTIELGVDFAEAISRAVAACQVLLAIIGPTWLTITDEQGRQRLDDPGDIVRLEVEAALARDVRVIPILVEGAHMPRREDLPGSLAGLARRNALPIRHESFRSDAERLVAAIERVLAPAPSTGAVSSREFDQIVPPLDHPTATLPGRPPGSVYRREGPIHVKPMLGNPGTGQDQSLPSGPETHEMGWLYRQPDMTSINQGPPRRGEDLAEQNLESPAGKIEPEDLPEEDQHGGGSAT